MDPYKMSELEDRYPSGTTGRVDDVDYAYLLAMRVAVAKDVSLQLDIKAIEAQSGIYLRLHGATRAVAADVARAGGDLRDALDRLAEDGASYETRCEACAVGASLLSYARLFDSVPVVHVDRWVQSTSPEPRGLCIYDSGNTDDACSLLWDALGETFCRRIEAVFEGDDGAYALDPRYGAYALDPRYGRVGSEERMRSIMEDVIEAAGEFTMPEPVDDDDDEPDYSDSLDEEM
jgi:hypothetical protein